MKRLGDFKLVCLSALGGYFEFVLVLREAIGRDVFPCAVFLICTQLILPLLAGPILVRLLRFFRKTQRQRIMSKMTFQELQKAIGGTNKKNLKLGVLSTFGNPSRRFQTSNSSKALKGKRQNRESFMLGTVSAKDATDLSWGAEVNFSAVVMGIIVTPFVLVIVVRLATSKLYSTACVGCYLVDVDLFIFMGECLLLAIVTLLILYQVKNQADPTGIMRTTRWSLIGASLVGLLGILMNGFAGVSCC